MSEPNITGELTPSQRFAGNLIAAIGIILCGLFLLLCGVGAFDIPVALVIAPAILATVGLVLLANAFIQSNTGALYLSVLFLMCALVSVLAHFTGELGYAELYPFYIAAPAIASVFTMFMSRSYSAHIKVLLVFGVPAVIFFMQSFGIWSWAVTLPALIMFVGLLALYLALSFRRRPEE